MPIVYVYKGQGAEEVDDYVKSLSEVLPSVFTVRLIDPKGIIGGGLDDGVLLVMPGGADLPYCKALKGVGNLKIKRFVQAGGRYLGICAGAYYASSSIVFDPQDAKNCIKGARELGFFKGVAYGPLMKKYVPGDPAGILAEKIELPGGYYSRLYYNGGPTFLNVTTEKVLGYYVKEGDAWYDKPLLDKRMRGKFPAILSIPYGQGKVVLSGVHLENTIFDAYVADKRFVSRKTLLRAILQEELELIPV